jgi:hypothetical protein
MWYGHLARHRQDACATSFTSEMEKLYLSIFYQLTKLLRYRVSRLNYQLGLFLVRNGN